MEIEGRTGCALHSAPFARDCRLLISRFARACRGVLGGERDGSTETVEGALQRHVQVFQNAWMEVSFERIHFSGPPSRDKSEYERMLLQYALYLALNPDETRVECETDVEDIAESCKQHQLNRSHDANMSQSEQEPPPPLAPVEVFELGSWIMVLFLYQTQPRQIVKGACSREDPIKMRLNEDWLRCLSSLVSCADSARGIQRVSITIAQHLWRVLHAFHFCVRIHVPKTASLTSTTTNALGFDLITEPLFGYKRAPHHPHEQKPPKNHRLESIHRLVQSASDLTNSTLNPMLARLDDSARRYRVSKAELQIAVDAVDNAEVVESESRPAEYRSQLNDLPAVSVPNILQPSFPLNLMALAHQPAPPHG